MWMAWDSDDKIFILVLVAALVGQTATHKNILGSTADATIGMFARLNESTAAPQRKPIPSIRRSSPMWAGTVAFFKAAATRFAKREHVTLRQTPKVPFQRQQSMSRRTWHIGVDRWSWPWKKRTTRTRPVPVPAGPRVAVAPQPPRF
jgi:hypothetical protein